MADPHREEIAKLETLYANNPEGRVFTHLAEAYRKSGELDRAREILEEGLRRHSDYSSAHVVLGRVLSDMGQSDGATAAFQRVLELDRHNLVALRSLGEIASGAGRTEDALHYYRELLSLDPSDDRLRTSVRTLEERLEAESAPPAPEAPAHEPGGFEAAAPAGFASGTTPGFEPGPAMPFGGEEAQAPGEEAEPQRVEGLETGAVDVSGLMAGWPAAEPEPMEASGEAGARSENWEEDVGIELEALPGDLGALAGEGAAAADAGEAGADEAWSAASEWVEDTAPFELPAGDLTLEDEVGGAAAEAARSDAETPDETVSAEAFGEAPPAGLEALDIDLGLRPESGEPVASEEAPAAAGWEWPAAEAEEGPGPEEGPVEALVPEPAVGEADGWTPAGLPDSAPPETAATPADAVPEPAAFVPEPEPAPEAGAAEEGALVTETMAELYFAQGFYDRSAEVYRSLLRSRPDDARLAGRLREAESMAAPADASADAGDRWLEGVESAWTGGSGVAGGETTPYAWAEPGSEEEPSGPAVGDYFRSLLSWRPGAGATAVAEPAGGEAWAAAETEAPAIGTDEEAVAELELMPDMETAEEDAVGPWGAASVQPPEPTEAASAAGAADEAPNEDEDLEMFRSWLQSLKK